MNIKFDEDEVLVLYKLPTEAYMTETKGQVSLIGTHLRVSNGLFGSDVFLPDWLADGIRELVKNKIEQENTRGA